MAPAQPVIRSVSSEPPHYGAAGGIAGGFCAGFTRTGAASDSGVNWPAGLGGDGAGGANARPFAVL